MPPSLVKQDVLFTPDLMPSDVTGTKMPSEHGSNALVFQPGPVFHRLLLADEINRATPKTQAAMLEAMAETQVTVLGVTYPLTKVSAVTVDGVALRARSPFLVLATQNPVDLEGTYTLPEAQLDRFLFKVRMPFPSATTLQWIIDLDVGRDDTLAAAAARASGAGYEETIARLHRAGRAVRETPLPPEVRRHILNIVMASVGTLDQVADIGGKGMAALGEFQRSEVDYPLGPRAAVFMTLAALAWAAVAEIEPDEPEQLGARAMNGLAATVVGVLRHRMKFRSGFAGLAALAGTGDDLESEADRHDRLVRTFVTLCAPESNGYARMFAAELDARRAGGL